MKLSELSYITADDIENASVNVTSVEAFDEAQALNTDMLRLQRRRISFLRDFWAVVFMNAAVVPIGLLGTSKSTSFFYRISGGDARPSLIVAAIFAAAFGYFVLFRRNYDRRLGALLTCILIPAHIVFAPCVAVNAILLGRMEKIDLGLKDQAGYPHFNQLATTFVRDEEPAEEGEMEDAQPEDPFAKYRIRPEDDPGMLADTDVNDGT